MRSTAVELLLEICGGKTISLHQREPERADPEWSNHPTVESSDIVGNGKQKIQDKEGEWR